MICHWMRKHHTAQFANRFTLYPSQHLAPIPSTDRFPLLLLSTVLLLALLRLVLPRPFLRPFPQFHRLYLRDRARQHRSLFYRLKAVGAQFLPQEHQTLKSRRQNGHRLKFRQRVQFPVFLNLLLYHRFLLLAIPVRVGVRRGPRQSLDRARLYVQVIAGVDHLDRVPLPRFLLLPLFVRRLYHRLPRNDEGALLRQAGMKLEEAGASHRVVHDPFVPEESREHGSQTLGHRWTDSFLHLVFVQIQRSIRIRILLAVGRGHGAFRPRLRYFSVIPSGQLPPVFRPGRANVEVSFHRRGRAVRTRLRLRLRNSLRTFLRILSKMNEINLILPLIYTFTYIFDRRNRKRREECLIARLPRRLLASVYRVDWLYYPRISCVKSYNLGLVRGREYWQLC